MASLGLRSAARVFRRFISDSAGKTQPTKHSCSEFNVGHGKHIQHVKGTCQPNMMHTSLRMQVEEHRRIIRGMHEDVKVMLQRRRDNEAWDKLQKRVILPSLGAITLVAICANKMLFGESRQEMPEEIKPLN